MSALLALRLPTWPAIWTVTLALTVSSYRRQRFKLTVTIVSEMHFNAIRCIVQPNTALHDCTLYLIQMHMIQAFHRTCV